MKRLRLEFGQLIVACVFSLFSVAGLAQDVLQYTSPADETEVHINTDQSVTVEWTRVGRPVFNGVVTVTSTFGTLSSATVMTDLNGVATFTISSADIGDAEVTISGEDPDSTVISDLLLLQFVDLGDSASSFGDIVTPENPTVLMNLLVFNDRIGFRGQPGVDINAVGELAASRGLVQEPPLDENLFVLRTRTVVGRGALRALAKDLEENATSVVLKTGLVAKLNRADQWLIVPDEVLLRFKEDVSDNDFGNVMDVIGDRDFTPNENDEFRFLIAIPDEDDVFQVSAQLMSMDGVEYAEPNYMIALKPRNPTQEPGYGSQWTLQSNADFGVDDADVDAVGAWDFSTGSSSTKIAVIDRGFHIGHEDLAGNLVGAVDLVDMDPTDLLSTATSYIQYGHGTAAAGVAAAVGTNNKGFTGACPSCKLVLIRKEADNNLIVDAFQAAVAQEVDVISNSWGFWGSYAPINNAISAAVDAGATVVFAMSNENIDNCSQYQDPMGWDISSHPRVIAVSGVTDSDRRAAAYGEAKGYGDCMDVVAPTRGGVQGVSTTYVVYNSSDPTMPIQTYVSDYGGTSAATPLVAGIVGLMKDVNDTLTPIDVQRILQDTSDRVAPFYAEYSRETGFSGSHPSSTYGYGRVNALEAVRLVAPADTVSDKHGAGRAGHDLLLRDHAHDWGNSHKDQPSTTLFSTPRVQVNRFKSVDVKIDVEPFGPPVTTPQQFAALSHEEPEVSKRFRVYVRLRNRGPATVSAANLKVIWAITGDEFPDLPSDFWTTFPADHTDTTNWQPLTVHQVTSVAYSGPSIAGCPGRPVPDCHPLAAPPTDAAQIAMFTLAAQDWDPAAGVGPTFFAVVDSAADHARGMVPSDLLNGSLKVLDNVVGDNNVTLWTVGAPFVVADPGACSMDKIQTVVALVIIGIILLIIVIVFWLLGINVPKWIYALLILTLILLLVFCVRYPGCMDATLVWLGIYL